MDEKFDRNVTRRVTYMVGLTILVAIGATSIYFTAFKNSALSRDPADWASFGAYLGGVLGPIIALGSLFGLALLIELQRITIKATRDEMIATKQNFINQNFSATVFELMRTLTSIREVVRWLPSGKYTIQNKGDCLFGEDAVIGSFNGVFDILELQEEFTETDCKKLLDLTYNRFIHTHQSFGMYWYVIKSSFDSLNLRSIGVQEEITRDGVRLFSRIFIGRELFIFYLIHCINREWSRLDFAEKHDIFDSHRDYIIERLRACRKYAMNNEMKYSFTVQDARNFYKKDE